LIKFSLNFYNILKNYFGILKLLFSFLLIFLVFKDLNFKEYFIALESVSLSRYLLTYFFISIGNVVIYAIKMNKIYLNNSLSFIESIKYILNFRFYNLVAPMLTPAVKFNNFKKIDKSKEALIFIFSEKTVENLIYGFFCLLIYFKSYSYRFIILFTVVIVSYFFFKKNIFLILKLTVLLAISKLFSALGLYILVLNFIQEINYFDILLISLLTTLVLSFPISFGGLGVREITLSRLLAEVLDNSTILVISNLLFTILLINGILGFLINLSDKNEKQ